MKQFAMIPLGAVRVGVLEYHLKESALKTLAYTDGDADYLIVINNAPEPETVKPLLLSISARPLMLTPPIPMK